MEEITATAVGAKRKIVQSGKELFSLLDDIFDTFQESLHEAQRQQAEVEPIAECMARPVRPRNEHPSDMERKVDLLVTNPNLINSNIPNEPESSEKNAAQEEIPKTRNLSRHIFRGQHNGSMPLNNRITVIGSNAGNTISSLATAWIGPQAVTQGTGATAPLRPTSAPLSHSTTHIRAPSSEQSAPPPPTSMTEQMEKLEELKSRIFDQIRFRLKAQFTEEKSAMTIKLRPRFLGKIKIDLLFNNNDPQATAHFSVENRTVQKILQNTMHELKDAFDQHDIPLNDIEITVPEDLTHSNGNARHSHEEQEAILEWMDNIMPAQEVDGPLDIGENATDGDSEHTINLTI